jgi:hypothetical protein
MSDDNDPHVRWEYNVVYIPANPSLKTQVAALDSVGIKGWELISAVRENAAVWLYLKRRMKSE